MPTPETDQLARLRSALAYYAAPHHWIYGDAPGHVYAHEDAGSLARKALGLDPNPSDCDQYQVEMDCREIMLEAYPL